MRRYIPRIRPNVLWVCGLGLWLVTLVGIRVVTTTASAAPAVAVENTAVQPNIPRPSVAQQSAIAATSGPLDVEECVT